MQNTTASTAILQVTDDGTRKFIHLKRMPLFSIAIAVLFQF